MPKSGQRSSMIVSVAILGELALEIAVPVIALTKLGKWLDGRYDWTPKALMTSFVLAFIISATIVWKRALSFRELYERGEL